MTPLDGIDPYMMGLFGGQSQGINNLSRQLMQEKALKFSSERNFAPYAGHMAQPRQGGFGGMFGGQQQEGPDFSSFTYDPAAREAAGKFLGQYGLSPLSPEQVNPNTLGITQGHFFRNHQRIANMLEGAVYGAATTRPSQTIGEGISNVAQSLIAGPQARHAAWSRQFAGPFEAAGQLEKMEDLSQKRDLQEAQIQHYRALEQQGTERIDATRPVPIEGGFLQFDSTTDPATGKPKGWTPRYDVDPVTRALSAGQGEAAFVAAKKKELGRDLTSSELLAAEQQWKSAAGTREGQGSAFDQVVRSRNAERQAQGLGPLDSNSLEALSSRMAGQQAGAREWANLVAQMRGGFKYTKEQDQQIKVLNAQFIDPKNNVNRDKIRMEIIQAPGGIPSGMDLDSAIDAEIAKRNNALQNKIQDTTDLFKQQNQVSGSPIPQQQPGLLNPGDETMGGYKGPLEGLPGIEKPLSSGATDRPNAPQQAVPAVPARAAKPPAGAPKVGTIEGGYRFKGGPAHDPNSWEKVQQ